MRDTISEKVPAYSAIADRLRESVSSGLIGPGTVLLEGPIAEIFGSSRAPVKQALAILEDEGHLERFAGRGLIVKGAAPRRIKLTAEAVGLSPEASALVKSFAWENFYYDFERAVTLQSTSGRFKINELALARHYGVGRTVARDLLVHAQMTGLVEKGEDTRWWIVALDEQRFANLYELRRHLEPAALGTAVGRVPPLVLDEFSQRLIDANNKFPDVDQAELDQLENDLHIRCLGYCRNPELVEALRRARATLIAGKHIQNELGRNPKIDPFMDEHLAIITAVRNEDARQASRLLLAHLDSSGVKAQERLAMFRQSPPPEGNIYVSR